MDSSTEAVKGHRRYDASRRRQSALRRQQAVLDAARTFFLRDGYAATTVAAVAAAGGVSVETVYKSFGGKPGLVRALQAAALAGTGVVPAPQRSDEMSSAQADPTNMLRGWAVLTTEVMPRVAPIVLLVRAAGATDPEMAALSGEINDQRLDRMTHNARRLVSRGGLRPGLTDEQVADVMFALTAPELFEILVLDRHWTNQQFGDFVFRGLVAQLLDPARRPAGRRGGAPGVTACR